MRPMAVAWAAALWTFATLASAARVGRGGEAQQQWPTRITLGNVAILPVRKVARLGVEAREVGRLEANRVQNDTDMDAEELAKIKPPMSKKVNWYKAPGFKMEGETDEKDEKEGDRAASPAAAPAAAPSSAPAAESADEAEEDPMEAAKDAAEAEEQDKILAKAQRVNKKAKRKLAESDHLHARAAHTVAKVEGDEADMKEAKANMKDAEARIAEAAEEHEDARHEHWEERKEYDEANAKLQKLSKKDLKVKEVGGPSKKLLIVAPLSAFACIFTIWAIRPRLDS